MKIYEIPICTRHINIGNGPINLKKHKYLCINDRGVVVTYDCEMDLDTKVLKSIVPVVGGSLQFFVAENYIDAIIQVFLEYKGMIIGGSSEFSKAVWINTGLPIIELPKCFMMHQNKSGCFTCGEPMPCGNSIFGWCFAEDSKGGFCCPLMYYEKEILDNYEKYINFAKEISYKKVKYMLITPDQVDYNQYEFPKTKFIKDGYIPIKLLKQYSS